VSSGAVPCFRQWPRQRGDLGTSISPGSNVTAALRPFLAARILGVIALGR